MNEIQLLQYYLKQAQGEANTERESLLLGELGNISFTLGEFAQAAELYQKALGCARIVHDRYSESATLSNLGNTYAALEDEKQAIELHQEALQIAQEMRDRSLESNILNNLGLAFDKQDQTSQAIEYYTKALQIAQEMRDRSLESNILNNLGLAFDKQDQTSQAIEYYTKALQIAQEMRDDEHIQDLIQKMFGESETASRKVRDEVASFQSQAEGDIGEKNRIHNHNPSSLPNNIMIEEKRLLEQVALQSDTRTSHPTIKNEIQKEGREGHRKRNATVPITNPSTAWNAFARRREQRHRLLPSRQRRVIKRTLAQTGSRTTPGGTVRRLLPTYYNSPIPTRSGKRHWKRDFRWLRITRQEILIVLICVVFCIGLLRVWTPFMPDVIVDLSILLSIVSIVVGILSLSSYYVSRRASKRNTDHPPT
ncbi:hypothetical protein KSF_088950 [Reticulibacter mediterranei]|uniref:Tetratricopeptide repeat protein n=1 Tax=Reticulibacter mediterranei TaxID=2778369 RepID=A0A8J3IXZ6_9CHLR|nr:tetratricopeptide repeat protein [Reticulibacter mediterranei]GHO98847.1 hypothetical protein KSF_088950 [Reticulibacter mediterranei]